MHVDRSAQDAVERTGKFAAAAHQQDTDEHVSRAADLERPVEHTDLEPADLAAAERLAGGAAARPDD